MVEIRILLPDKNTAALEILNITLQNAGIPKEKIVENIEKKHTFLSVFFSNPRQALSCISKIKGLNLKNTRFYMRNLKDSQWKTLWKKYFQPINITKDICIVPIWLKNRKIETTSKKIYIDTSVAFGTGLHATTQMMSRLIKKEKGNFCNFLDIGTGSGILAIVARYYGAENIYAIDSDKKATKTAKHNFILNNCPVKYVKTACFPENKIKIKFDFIAANLLTQDLLKVKKYLVASLKKGGYLAVSGIFKDNFPLFNNGFKNLRLKELLSLKKNGWHAVLFQKI